MSSIIRTGGSNIDRSAELRGLSTDTKPTRANGNEVPHGSTWYNMDDSTKYMYNADNDTWYNIPNGGGGGTGDMQKSVYDPTNTVANAGGIDTYVETEIGDAKEEIINEVSGNIAVTANNLIKDTVGWNNKNLLPITLSSLQEINTNGTWDDNVYTYRNITITVETDIYNLITDIKVNGANTAGSVAFKLTNNFVYQLLSEDKYYISDGVDVTAIVDGSAYISVERKKGESGETHYLSTNNENRSTKFTVDYATYDYYAVSIYIPNNSSINNAVFYPMIRRASISDATYEPYRSTVEDELNSIDSAIGTLNANLGIANSRITNLQNNKADKSDLGTASTKNSTSVVTESSDLVESGAVKELVGWGNKNLLPNNAVSQTINGITYTVNSDGSITANETGTHSSSSYLLLSGGFGADRVTLPDWLEIGKDYIVSNTNNGVKVFIAFYDANGDSIVNYDNTRFTVPSNAVYFGVFVYVGGSTHPSNVTLYPMIRKADVTDASYEPYHKSVEQCLYDSEVIPSKNLVDITVQALGGFQYGTKLPTGLRTFTVSAKSNGTGQLNMIVYKANVDEVLINHMALITNGSTYGSHTANISEDGRICIYAVNSGQTGNFSEVQIEAGTEATSYVPYYVPLKDVVPTKCDNTVIAPVENGTATSQAYAVGSHAIRNGKFITWKNAKAQGETINDASDYTSGDVASELITEDVTYTFTAGNPTIGSNTAVTKNGNIIKAIFDITPETAINLWSDFITINAKASKVRRFVATIIDVSNNTYNMFVGWIDSNGSPNIGFTFNANTRYIINFDYMI